jgi:ferredoxin
MLLASKSAHAATARGARAQKQQQQKQCAVAGAAAPRSRRLAAAARPSAAAAAHRVEVEHGGKTTVLEVEDGASILDAALDAGLDLPHDCRLGVCMTCPAKLVSGTVDQSGAMLSDDVVDKGFALLCVSVPQTDVRVRTISEEELLDEQLVAGAQ